MTQPIKKLEDIQQDQGDSDCGPTCVAFFRYGGVQRMDKPPIEGGSLGEAGIAIKPSMIQKMADVMRADPRVRDDNVKDGLNARELYHLLNHWAAIWGKKRYKWDIKDCSGHRFDFDLWNTYRQAYLELGASKAGRAQRKAQKKFDTANEAISKDGRDDMDVFVMALTEALAIEGPQRPGVLIQVGGTKSEEMNGHYLVVTELVDETNDDNVTVFDPSPLKNKVYEIRTRFLLATHLYFRGRGSTGTIFFGVTPMKPGETLPPLPRVGGKDPTLGSEISLSSKRVFALIDVGLTKESFQLADTEIRWFNSHREADWAAVGEVQKGKTVAVLEVLHGIFALAEVDTSQKELRGVADSVNKEIQGWRATESIRIYAPSSHGFPARAVSVDLSKGKKEKTLSHRGHDWFE
jgi:hypothetical protein